VKPHVFESGDKVYLVSPIAPIQVNAADIEQFAFADEMAKLAPNENLYWLKGKYVEADNPNRNGHVWEEGELAIKSLSPMFMPVTVMHDPRTAVGLIADAALRTPEADKVPRAYIETAMGLWAHRFPEVAEECRINYEAGTLMQSMECRSPYYTCIACNETFPKLLDGAERKNWCSHMRDSDGHAARILGDVTFTGTGLIFGTRGARGAYDEAHLEEFQAEVAEFHAQAQSPETKRPKRRKTSMDDVTLTQEKYDALNARPTPEALAAEKKRADDAETAQAEAERKVEKLEADLNTANEAKAEAEKKVADAEEEKAKATLAKERLGKLGKGFVAKFGEFTKERVEAQARDLSDEDWENRLKELEETTEVARDEGGTSTASTETSGTEFSREEVARAHTTSNNGGGGAGGDGKEPSPEARQSAVRGLIPSRKQ
jgi:hypothetical protein